MTDKNKKPQPEQDTAQDSTPEPEQPRMKTVQFEVPEGITRGVFVYEVEGYPSPLSNGHGNISLGQMYRLFQEVIVGVNTRMIADAVEERLMGAMQPPPEMMGEGTMPDMPESPHSEAVEDDIPDPSEAN